MDVEYKIQNQTFIVKLKGELDDHVAKNLRDQLDEVIVKNKIQNIIFDLSGLTFIDSSGIGLIIGRYKKATTNGGKKAKVVKVPKKINKIFEMAGIYHIYDKYDTLEKAIESI